VTICFNAAPGVDVVATSADIPTLGRLPINAYVLHGTEPILVDAGPVVGNTEFMAALRTVIDPAELRWIWLTHPDFDHIGSLPALLEENPDVRVITSFQGVGYMSISASPLPMDRVYLVNPGQTVAVGDRRLTALKPPLFDNPITVGFVDDQTGALFSSDCFGAVLPSVPESASDIDASLLRSGQILWATIDSCWVHDIDRTAFASKLQDLRSVEPSLLCSSHLPPAPGAMLPDFLGALAEVPDAPRYQAPDQAALMAMFASGGH
jgi:hypothetical protein